MHRLLTSALAALLVVVSLGSAPAPVAATTETPAKVVVVVGPVGSMTDTYRARAEAIATEARRYTSDVTTLYSPNATWERVKAALQGANVVVYLGHGNGFPSPYSTTLRPTSQNGLGLNPTLGGDDATTRYWGESYVATEVRLAPHAVVFLHHLCYASGNGEPGSAEPTLSVARQRIDNYGAGFIAAGAAAVVVDAHYGSSYYMTALFTTSQTLDAVWRNAPRMNGNFSTFPSVRTPGALGQMDPTTPTSGFYRSFVGDPTTRTTDVLAGAGDSTPIDGIVDTVPPTLTAGSSTALAAVTFSPNGDGIADAVGFPVALDEGAMLEVAARPAAGGDPVRSWSLPGVIGLTTIRWDGRRDDGLVAPDGRYELSVVARDAAGNASAVLVKPVAVHTVLTGVRSSRPAFWPTDPNLTAPRATRFYFTLAAPAIVTVGVVDAAVRTVVPLATRVSLSSGTYSYVWNGRGTDGTFVAPGTYRVSVVAASTGLATRLMAPVGLGMFQLTCSATAVSRGGSVVLSAIAAEALSAAPVVTVSQPGLLPRSIRMTLSSGRWVAKVTALTGGSAGTLSMKVTGADLAGVKGSSTLAIPLR